MASVAFLSKTLRLLFFYDFPDGYLTWQHLSIVPSYHCTIVLLSLSLYLTWVLLLPHLSLFLCLSSILSVSLISSLSLLHVSLSSHFRLFLFGKKSKRRSPFGLFESCREKQISLRFMRHLEKLQRKGQNGTTREINS